MKNRIRPNWTRYNSRQLAEKSEFFRLLDWISKADPTEDPIGLSLVNLSFSMSVRLDRFTSGGYRHSSCRVDTKIHIAT